MQLKCPIHIFPSFQVNVLNQGLECQIMRTLFVLTSEMTSSTCKCSDCSAKTGLEILYWLGDHSFLHYSIIILNQTQCAVSDPFGITFDYPKRENFYCNVM